MAESSSQGAPSGPIVKSLKIVLFVFLVLFAAKVYLRAPEYRYIEVCYFPHKVFQLAWIDSWGLFVPDDSASYLSHANDVSNFFRTCTQHAAGWDWLRTIGTHQ
ncbi:hypothetical protein [Pseudomonas putida]|uniref:hypothetical protein n=1 Tax=Pseudomonas putida TaxID=303 RepID=UPI002B240C0D|nr:hypothetical protein [Pseudomonas putida]